MSRQGKRVSLRTLTEEEHARHTLLKEILNTQTTQLGKQLTKRYRGYCAKCGCSARNCKKSFVAIPQESSPEDVPQLSTENTRLCGKCCGKIRRLHGISKGRMFIQLVTNCFPEKAKPSRNLQPVPSSELIFIEFGFWKEAASVSFLTIFTYHSALYLWWVIRDFREEI